GLRSGNVFQETVSLFDEHDVLEVIVWSHRLSVFIEEYKQHTDEERFFRVFRNHLELYNRRTLEQSIGRNRTSGVEHLPLTADEQGADTGFQSSLYVGSDSF